MLKTPYATIKRKFVLPLASLVLALALCACNGAYVGEKESTKNAPLIFEKKLANHIEILASDAFEGRAPATKGGRLASDYIAYSMQKAGLVPMGSLANAEHEASYFQNINFKEITLDATSASLYITRNKGDKMALNYGEDVVYWTKREQENIVVEKSDMVFVGYGVVAPEYGWNDYEGLDVKGKTVVMLVNDPGFAGAKNAQGKDLFKGRSMTYYGRWVYKFEEAARQGAKAAIIIHETKPASYGWGVVSGSWAGAQIDLARPDKGQSRTALEGWVTRDKAHALLREAGHDLEDLKNQARQQGFKPIALNGLRLTANFNNSLDTVRSRNVIGAVKGHKYPDEYVLYMAHWDHLGKKNAKEAQEGEDLIYNGAVDNATGTAAILAIGEAFQKAPPARSVLIIALTAEESGLLGSAYYAQNPVVPLHKTVAGINIDGVLPIGKTEDIIVVGYGASQLDGLLEKTAKAHDIYLTPDQKPEAGYYYRSDHISLAKLGVPMLYADAGLVHRVHGKAYGKEFSQNYTKNRYHGVADEYTSDWDLSGLAQLSTIFYEMGRTMAQTRMWPNWHEGAEFRALRDAMRAQDEK